MLEGFRFKTPPIYHKGAFQFWGIIFAAFVLIGAMFVVGALLVGAGTVAKGANINFIPENIPVVGPFAGFVKAITGLEVYTPPSGTTVTVGPGGVTTTITSGASTTPAKTGTFQIRFTISDGYGSAVTAGNEYAVFMLNSNYLSAYEAMADPTASQVTTKTFTNGDKVDVVVASDNDETGATDYYMRWYTITSVADKAPIVCKETGVVVGYLQYYTDGTNTYWHINELPLVPRASATNTDLSIVLRGTTLVSITTGTAQTTKAGQTADGSMTANTDNMRVDVTLGVKRVSAFDAYYVIDGTGQPQIRESYLAVFFNNTGMKVRAEAGSGSNVWFSVDSHSTTWVAYAVKIQPIRGTTLLEGSASIIIPLDATDVSTRGIAVNALGYILDGQTLSAIQSGSGTSAKPGSFGALAASANMISPDVPIYATPPTVSSGTPSGETFDVDFTVPVS